MSIFDKIKIREAPFVPSLNTGTLMDIATGFYIPGDNGSTILNGGIGLTNGFIGRPQMYKSTLATGMGINAYARCPGSDMVIYDTEKTLQKQRILSMSDIPIPKENRLKLISRSEYHAEDFFELVKAISQEKINHVKDYLVEIPHIDPKTGKTMKMIRPTFICTDSWTKMESNLVAGILSPDLRVEDGEIQSKTSITDSDTNTIFMKDGLIKKKMLSEFNSMAERSGIYFIFTAHIGEKIEMGYFPSPKSLQHMKLSDKIKGVGSDFLFLMMNLLDSRSAKILSHDNKDTLYPTKTMKTSYQDLNEVIQVVARCKGNTSGQLMKMVISQAEGLLPSLTDYHLLKSDKYWGMTGSPIKHNLVLYPKESLSRTTINDKLRESPKLRRALQILAELYYIQNNWTLINTPVDFMIKPQTLADKIINTKLEDDILNSRGWWTYDKHDQPYLSLVDILGLIK